MFSHYLGQITDETIFLSQTTPADIESLTALNQIKLLAPTAYQQKYYKNSKLNSQNH